MEQQTAVEWFTNELLKNEDIRWRGTDIYELSNQAKQMEKEEKLGDMVRLLRWVLKHYNTGTDIDGFFMWENPIGEEFDSIEIAKKYYNETFT